MSEIKFTEDELKGLQDIQQQYQSVQMQLGGLKMQQIAHEKNAERLNKRSSDCGLGRRSACGNWLH